MRRQHLGPQCRSIKSVLAKMPVFICPLRNLTPTPKSAVRRGERLPLRFFISCQLHCKPLAPYGGCRRGGTSPARILPPGQGPLEVEVPFRDLPASTTLDYATSGGLITWTLPALAIFAGVRTRTRDPARAPQTQLPRAYSGTRTFALCVTTHPGGARRRRAVRERARRPRERVPGEHPYLKRVVGGPKSGNCRSSTQ